MPKIIKIQILTLKFHFFTNFVNFYQKAIFFKYASPQKILDHKNFPKVKNRHACDPKMPKFGLFNFFFARTPNNQDVKPFSDPVRPFWTPWRLRE